MERNPTPRGDLVDVLHPATPEDIYQVLRDSQIEPRHPSFGPSRELEEQVQGFLHEIASNDSELISFRGIPMRNIRVASLIVWAERGKQFYRLAEVAKIDMLNQHTAIPPLNPGGKIKTYETPFDAALRELEEETDITISPRKASKKLRPKKPTVSVKRSSKFPFIPTRQEVYKFSLKVNRSEFEKVSRNRVVQDGANEVVLDWIPVSTSLEPIVKSE